MHARRAQLSHQFLKGNGIEIGALHQPLAVPPAAKVTYVDRMSVDDLRKHYPELQSCNLTPVGRIDDGEKLHTFSGRSLNFIIANHMIEHCENPLGTIRSHLSKLRSPLFGRKGVLYYAIPDKRKTFDRDRPVTKWEHFENDDRNGPSGSRWNHYLDYAANVEKVSPEHVEPRAKQLEAMNYSIHFHVWDFDSFKDFLERARVYLKNSFKVEHLEQNEMEVVAILRPTGWR